MKRKNLFYISIGIVVVFFAVIVVFRTFLLADPSDRTEQVRAPVVAGTFYPQDAAELSRAVKGYLDSGEKLDISGKIRGLVVPHAGYPYSAKIAAAGYRQAADQSIDLVVVMAPSHRDPFVGATIYPGDAYQTPLGKIAIDKQIAADLVRSCEYIQFSMLGHQQEHALEVQLPFIQTLFPDAKLIPMVIGRYSWDICQEIGHILAEVCAPRNVLLIASSDLYHGYSYDECKKADEVTLNAIVQFTPEKLCSGFLQESYQACGGGPAVAMLVAARALGADRAELIARTNSGDVTGNRSGYIVGYGAVAVFEQQSGKIEYPPLNANVQRELLIMARKAISHYLENRSIPRFEPTDEQMEQKRGVFVTLTERGQLRGCIGQHQTDRPLYELVPEMAIHAAFGDPRFPALTTSELKEVEIKISVYLTNVYRIQSIEEFEMGTHGIILQKNGRSATYLPEVPLEAGWKTKEEEMVNLCRKAGLPQDAWRSDAEFWVYKTQVFDEK